MFGRFFRKNSHAAKPQSAGPVYAIGDIHGCVNLLDSLLDLIERDADGAAAKLIFLGDYVDRGPDSRAVLDRLTKLQVNAAKSFFLKGNHEAVMLDFLKKPDATAHWLDWGGRETLASYGVDDLGKAPADMRDALLGVLPREHLDFLNQLDLSHRDGDYYFVHAGIRPGVALEAQREEDLLWIRKAFHQCPSDKRPAETIVHGHTPIQRPLDEGWRIALDTGAFWTGRLTALAINGAERKFIST